MVLSKDKEGLTSTWVAWKGFKKWFEKSILRQDVNRAFQKGEQIMSRNRMLRINLETKKVIG